MKFLYILKFIFFTNNGQFRYSYLFPMIGAVIGSYIIFMIYSIMNGMEVQINNRLDAFHYKYYIDDITYLDKSNSIKFINKGTTEIGYIKNLFYDDVINVHLLDDFEGYINNKIKNFIIAKSDIITNSDVLIGDQLASRMGLTIGDTINISYPSNMNIATNQIPFYNLTVGGIYDINLLNYDYDCIITSLKNLDINNYGKIKYFFDDSYNNSNIKLKENTIISNMIINALEIEKKLYYFFGILTIVISCFMLFQSILQSIKEKIKQISIITILGLNKFRMISILLLQNIIFITIMSLIGLSITNLTIYLNLNHDLFNFVYDSLPFDVIYVNIMNIEIISLLCIINIIVVTSSIIPMFIIYKRQNYVRF